MGPNLIGDLAEENFDEDTSPEDMNEYTGERPSNRDGFYFGALGGIGYASMSFELGGGLPEGTLTGIPIGLNVLLGGSPMPDLAVGVILGGGSASNPKLSLPLPAGTDVTTFEAAGFEVDGDTLTFTDQSLNLVRAGAFLDYYFVADSNVHAMLDISYMSVFFSGGDNDSDDLVGPAFGLGLGYDFWLNRHWSLGLLGHFTLAPLSASNSDTSTTLLYPELLANITFH
jgi:hypothetical protein